MRIQHVAVRFSVALSVHTFMTLAPELPAEPGEPSPTGAESVAPQVEVMVLSASWFRKIQVEQSRIWRSKQVSIDERQKQ